MRFQLSILLTALLTTITPAAGLKGMQVTLGGYTFGSVNENTGAFTPLATYSLPNVLSVNQMTYHPGAKQYVFTAFVDFNNAYLLTIDAFNYQLSAPSTPIPTTFVEGIEYSPALGGLVAAYGSNNFTNSLILMDGFYNQMAIKNLATSNLDMDCLFVSGTNSALNKMDSNNSWMGNQRHIINNPFGAHTYTAVGNNYWTPSDYDLAYNPVNGMNYLTRGNSLAVVHSLTSAPATIGNYGGPFITALAYGPDPKTVQGTIILSDTVASFPLTSRQISYQLLQNNNVISSGTYYMTSPSLFFQFQVLDSNAGPATLVFNGSSFLRKTVPVNLSDPVVLAGPVPMQNGDPDFSGEVDAADIDLVIARFGNTYPSNLPNPDADVDSSGEVDAADIDICIANFGGVDN